MTIDEALLVPDSEEFQPEGKWVAEAYEQGKLQDVETCLYVIAHLLHQINKR